MKLFLLTLVIILSSSTVSLQSQGCLPNGITFNNQQQVDNFATNYPGCSEILGDVVISYGINNLLGLSQITAIQGKLTITNNTLNNLTGLNNLTNVGSDTKILINSVTSFSGLNNLQSIEGSLEISNCTSLNNISAFESLTTIDGYLLLENNGFNEIGGLNNLINLSGDLYIQDNPSLLTLNGFNNLNNINGNFEIINNDSLLNLLGLSTLTNIEGNVQLQGNSALINFEGLNGLETIKGGVRINGNDALLNFQGFDNLYSTGVDQFDRFEVENNDNLINFIGLDNIHIISELRIANSEFLENLQGLNTLETVGPGNLTIAATNLTNLEGLDNLRSIGWQFRISGNEELINLLGVNNLETIGGGFDIIDNPLLQNFEGLENLNSISSLYIDACYQLENLSGFETLVSLNNGTIDITYRNNITSLNGLQNIDYTTINTLQLQYIDSLSECSLPNICTYIYNNGTAYITQNAPGCNSKLDILDHCDPLSITDEDQVKKTEIFPNPTNDIFEIRYPINIENVKVYTTLGNKVKDFKNTAIYNISDLHPGMYIVVIETHIGKNVSKLVKN